MAEFLLELLSEEIPARMQARAAEDLRRLFCDRLRAAGLSFDSAAAHVTPRRLVLVVAGLPNKQPDTVDERKGPRPDAPKQAIQGFLKANGLKAVKDAELRETDKGSFYFAVRRIKGQATAKVLPELVAEVVRGFPWPKSMRWAGGQLRWVRPLHAALAVFDGRPLRGGIDLDQNDARLPFGDTTVGHRFLAPKRFKVAGFADYEKKLRAHKVMLDRDERRAAIVAQAKRRAAAAKLTLKDDPALFDEVAGLVEWPVVLAGRIDEDYMDLPPEVLTTAMRAHQKYLALLDREGRPAPHFLVVANMETADKGKAIAAGNERVLRARLSDARFFWDQDRKVPLRQRTPALRDIVFHARLGTLDDKIDRVQVLAARIARQVPGADVDRVSSAARLAKADLVTGMVGEFPELQGVMGRYYALHDGEHADVADAIAEHYAPLGPNDACPTKPNSVCVALADKIDTLVGFFAIDEKPTGSKDPYALRRAALGVIRLIVENGLRLPLRPLFELAYNNGRFDTADRAGVIDGLLDFFAERLKVALRDQGVRHDLVAAVFAAGREDDLVRLLARVRALESFLASDDGANLLVAYRRAANIVRIESKRDKAVYNGEEVDLGRLIAPEEKALAECILEAQSGAGDALADEDFTAAMTALSGLRRPVDLFFDRVTVNAEDADLRANRLRLLSRIGATLDRVADFSKIEG